MDWIKFEKAKTLKQEIIRQRKNVYWAENRSALLLGLWDKQVVKEKWKLVCDYDTTKDA